MAIKLQVKCIAKADSHNAHERIQIIGGNINGLHWKHELDYAIQCIICGIYTYYVKNAEGQEIPVIIAINSYGHSYLKTAMDGEQPDNLLSLPECPVPE
jgi:hypothetical protein